MKNWKKIIGYIFGIALVLYLFVSSNFEWQKLSYLSASDFLWISFVSIFLLILNGVSLSPQLSLFGFKVSKSEIFFISQFYNLLNYLPLKAGLIGEGVQLNLRYGFPYKKYISVNIISYGLNFLLYAVVALPLFIFSDFSSIFPFVKPIYFFVFILVFIIGTIIYLLLPNHLISNKTFSLFFEDREVIWKSKKYLLVLFVISAFGLIANAVRLFFLFSILGYDIPIATAFVMSILASVAFLFGVTPGGIGIREGFLGALSYFIFQDIGAGVVVSMITRVFDFSWTCIFGAYAFHFLTKNNFFQKNEKIEKHIA